MILRGEEVVRAPKQRDFFVNIFQKIPKRYLFWPFFFSNFCLRRKKFSQNSVFIMVCESSENEFGQLEKKSIKFRKFFENSPPRENPRSAPV